MHAEESNCSLVPPIPSHPSLKREERRVEKRYYPNNRCWESSRTATEVWG